MTLIGLPSTLPPKSSTAICAAVTEPCPVGVDAGPFMSVSTPILTTSSDIWACAAGDHSSSAAHAPSTARFLADIMSPPACLRPLAAFAWPELSAAGRPSCNYSKGEVNETRFRPMDRRSRSRCGSPAGQFQGCRLWRGLQISVLFQSFDIDAIVAVKAARDADVRPAQRVAIDPAG